MRSRPNDRRAARLQGWLTYAPASVRSNPVLSDVRTFKGKKRERWLMPVWDMLVHSYSAIGVPHREPQELLAEYPVWQVVFDAEGVPRAFSLAKQTRYGLKAAASGSDGSLDGRDTVKDDIARRFLRAGEYGEVSGAVEKLVTRAGAPVVCAAYVPEVIGKPVDAEEDGQHYSREIRGAGRHTKIMVGRPKRVPTTTYASGECPLPRRAAANPMLLKTPEQWKEYGRMVTAAYARAPMFDKREAWRWTLLAKHIERMYKQMLSDIRVEFVAGQPYETAEEMSRKVKKSGVMYISTDFNAHPIFTPLQNLQFRAVHDYIVHIAKDKSFTLKGEIGSYNAHAKLVPPDALPALYTEVVGQASTYFTTGEFPKQKIAVLPFDPIRIGIELLRAEQPARAAANGRARPNAGLSKREKMMVESGIISAPPEGYVKPGTFGPFVPMIGKYKYKVKMNAEQDYLDVALYEGTRRVGTLQLSPIENMRRVSPRCVSLIEGLNPPVGEYESIRGWYVSWSEVQVEWRGVGLGRLLYDAAIDAMFKARGGWRGEPGPFVFMPGDCSTIGSTSKEARRVWPSLARDWPHKMYTSQTISGEPVHVFVIRVDHPPVFKAPRAAARAAANGRARRNPQTDVYPWDASTKVQSLQFDKGVFTADEAKAWAKTHDFKYGKVDVGKGNWLRLRQADPEHFRPSTFRVISFRDGVQAVIAVPKRSHR
jgi:hypothetical protein